MRRFHHIAALTLLACGCTQDFATARIVDGQVTLRPTPDFSTEVDGGFTLEIMGARDDGATASELHVAYFSACGVEVSSHPSEEISWPIEFPLLVEPGATLHVPVAVHGRTWWDLSGESTCSVTIRFDDVARYDYDDEGQTYAEGNIAITD